MLRAASCSRTALLFFAIFVAASAASDDTVYGLWATPGLGSKVALEACGADGQALCGRIVWLWEAEDVEGRPRTDVRNPERKRRGVPLVGAQIVSGFQRGDDGVWRGGRLYNPDDGRSYTGTLRMLPTGVLQLEGCTLRVFCKTQVWRRLDTVCPLATVVL